MGRPPLSKKQRQFAVALPPETRNYLEAAAAVSGHSVAEEIRRRIDKTIEWDGIDPVTSELLEGIKNIAALLRADYGAEWHANWNAYEALTVALLERLHGYQGLAEWALPGASALIGPDDPFHTVGRMRERDDRQQHRYEHLLEALERDSIMMRRYDRHTKAKQESDHD